LKQRPRQLTPCCMHCSLSFRSDCWLWRNSFRRKMKQSLNLAVEGRSPRCITSLRNGHFHSYSATPTGDYSQLFVRSFSIAESMRVREANTKHSCVNTASPEIVCRLSAICYCGCFSTSTSLM
jgi:hypothetical protein